MSLSSVIKIRRKELGLTLNEIAEYMGVSEATVQRWESGNIRSLRQGRIAKLAEFLHVSPASLMDWTDETEKPVSNEEDGQIKDLIDVFNSLTSEHQSQAVDYLHFLSAQEQKK